MGKIRKKLCSMLLTGCMTAGMLLPSMGISEVKAAANVADGLAGY